MTVANTRIFGLKMIKRIFIKNSLIHLERITFLLSIIISQTDIFLLSWPSRGAHLARIPWAWHPWVNGSIIATAVTNILKHLKKVCHIYIVLILYLWLHTRAHNTHTKRNNKPWERERWKEWQRHKIYSTSLWKESRQDYVSCLEILKQ